MVKVIIFIGCYDVTIYRLILLVTLKDVKNTYIVNIWSKIILGPSNTLYSQAKNKYTDI